jgi:hypothetical protein
LIRKHGLLSREKLVAMQVTPGMVDAFFQPVPQELQLPVAGKVMARL